jgi:signal transduction histidine kinase
VGYAEVFILIVASCVSLLIGFAVLSRKASNVTNILFSLLSVVLFVWSVANYLSLRATTDSSSLLIVKLIFITVVFQNTLLLLFLCSYGTRNPKKVFRSNSLYIVFSLVLLYLIAAGYIVEDFVDGKLVVAPLIILFMLHALYSVIRGFIKNSKLKTSESQKKMLRYGLVVLWIIVPITNFILPSFFGITIFVRFSALYVLAFNSLIAYAIIKHKLFNLRAFFARTSAYILTIAAFLSVYIAVITIINRFLFADSEISLNLQVLYAFIAVVSAPLLLITKKKFDKLSSRIFYRDSYESQELIDELNKALVTNVDLEGLLTKSALILQENLKTSFATFFIRETSYFKSRIIGAHRRQPEYYDIDKLQDIASLIGKRVFIVDDKNTGSENERLLKSILDKNEIEIMARLVSTLDFDIKGIGYLFLGAKKSGTPYSKQDLTIIEIVANELVIAVENVLRFEEIEQFNVTLQKKIDDATKELKQTNEKLRALDEAKDEFVSMASHQLRTPLTSIKGYISMVLEGDAGDINETQKKMLGQAFFSSQRMVYLISDLLNVSRLKTGKFIIETKPVYLPDVVESEITQLIEGANTKNLTLSFTKPKTFAIMNLDEMKLRQVIMNFTDNAIYYTPAGGKIIVELKETAKSIEFTVKDSGIGVPKEQQQKLFTKFYRADNARKARPDGTGLGLFMAKKVIIAQGGSLIFDSKENKGSTFGFSFPKDRLEIKADLTDKNNRKNTVK